MNDLATNSSVAELSVAADSGPQASAGAESFSAFRTALAADNALLADAD